MKAKFLTAIISFSILLLGCESTDSIKAKALDHDTAYISDSIIEAYQANDYEKYNGLCDETIEAYSEILSDLHKNNAEYEEFETYKLNLETIQANYKFMISQYDSFTVDLDTLILEFSN